MLTDTHRTKELHPRGISDEVIAAVPDRYQSFEQGNWQRFAELMAVPKSMPKPTRAALKGKVRQTSGIVIKRWDVNGHALPPYARLDDDVYMRPGRRTHYIYRPAYKTKHVDMHPLALSRIAAGQPIYLCLEGCFKADAVLSQGAAAISSTSVTTWNGNDLARLLPILRAAPRVFVVPDSDFYASDRYDGSFNPMVVWQTRRAAQWLLAKGVNVVIAVPWLGSAVKVGIDDFLAQGHGLDELTEERPLHNAFLAAVGLTRAERRVLSYLLQTQGTWGAFYPQAVAVELDINRKTVWRATEKLEGMGVLRVWDGKPVELEDGTYKNDPHVFKSFELVERYTTWLETLPVPPLRVAG